MKPIVEHLLSALRDEHDQVLLEFALRLAAKDRREAERVARVSCASRAGTGPARLATAHYG
jgi:hypothetical protein